MQLLIYLYSILHFLKVRFLIEINQTAEIEGVVIKLCEEIKLFLDIDVCIGAVHEYAVNLSYCSNQFICVLSIF